MKLLSPAKVIAVDTAADKRREAAELGADLVVDPSEIDAVAELSAAAGPDGAAAVIDYVGSDESMALAASVVGRQGIVVLVGLAGGSLGVSFFGLATEASVTSSYWGSRNELDDVLALARRGLLHHQVTTASLDDINDVVDRLHRGQVAGRVVLTP